MFDPNVLLRPPERIQAWDAYPLRHHPFSGEAWEEAPQVSPRDPGFRQLAVPEHARVHHDDSEFEITTYVSLTPAGFEVEQHTPIQSRASQESQPEVVEADFAAEGATPEQSAEDQEASHDNPQAQASGVADALTDLPPDEPTQAVPAEHPDSPEPEGLRPLDSPVPPEAMDPIGQPLEHTASADERVWQQRLEDAVAQARHEALQEGIAQGRQLALNENLEAALAQAKVNWASEVSAAHTQAIDEAVTQALAEQSQRLAQQSGERNDRLIELMTCIDQTLQHTLAQTQVWGEAIKRLSIHIAEQLVLAELSASPAAIQRLIDRCVAELDLPHAGLVTVELAPQDLDLIKAQPDLSWNGMDLVMNHQLQPGSVKVSCKDTRVSDLILHRLEPMARQLLVAVDDWQQQSAFRPGQAASRPSPQTARAATPMPAAITPLSVSSRLIDSTDFGGEHG